METKSESACTLSEEELKRKLTPEQYRIVRENGTEAPFHNEYWNNKRPGLYVDIVSGEPLFSSTDKFDSGTGWPSFTRPIEENRVRELPDMSHGRNRTEVRSTGANSHLGHVFNDGPGPTGLRYCINSAALRFVPVEDLEKENLQAYRSLFDASKRQESAIATFAAGCFWGVEEAFRTLPGVRSTRVGYTGGSTDHPTYQEVCSDRTGHAEAVEIEFDPSVVSYESLVKKFFELHDPTQLNRQGPDVGTQYRSAVFVHSDEQKEVVERVRAELERGKKFSRPIVTQVVSAAHFYPAEDYHQKYLLKRGKSSCGI